MKRGFEAPPIDPFVDFVLREWGRWARGWRNVGNGSCASIEKFYTPERGAIYAEVRALRVDERQALAVETIWRSSVPLRERLLLRAHYVTAPSRSSEAWAAHVRRNSRQLGIRPADWPTEVGQAARIVAQYVDHWRMP